MMNNKTISKWFSMLLLMLVAGISGAAAQSLSISDFSIKAGETKTVAIKLTAENAIYGVQTDLELCEGLTFVQGSAQSINENLMLSVNDNLNGGKKRMSLLSLAGNVISAGDIISLKLTAADDFEGGTITLSNSRLTTSTAGAEAKVSDTEATVTLESEPGIDPNELIVNGDFEGEYTVFVNPKSDRAIYQPAGWTVTRIGDDANDMSILKSTDLASNNFSAFTINDPSTRGNQTYWTRLRWGNNTGLKLSQEVTLPAGSYTLSALVLNYNNNKGNNKAEVFVGSNSVAASNSNTKGDGAGWKTMTVNFTIEETTEVELGFKLTHATESDGEQIVGVDNFVLTYTDLKAELRAVIAQAKAINARISTLNDAIATARLTLNNIEASKSDIDNAVAALRSAISTGLAAYTELNAEGDDITSFIANNGFETSPIFDGTSLGSGSDPKSNATPTEGSTLLFNAANVYQINGWEQMTTETLDFARTFTMPYNTTLYVKGDGKDGAQAVASPANGSSVTTDNNSLLFVEANWCENKILGVKQTLPLPKGSYRLTFDSYVTNFIGNANSLCGVSYGETTNYKWPAELNTWTANEIDFTLGEQTDVTISMGYKKIGNVGGGGSAFLFIDNVKLTYFDPLKLAQLQWHTVHDALEALDATALPDAAETAITDELAKSVPTTVDDVNAATAALQALIDSYDGIKAAYDEYKAMRLAVEDLKNTDKYSFTGADALNTFNTTLSTIDENAENATGAEVLTELLPSLKVAGNTFVAGIESTDGFDLTYNIVNNSFETGVLTPWSTTGSNDTGVKENSNGTYTTTGVDGNYLFNTWNNGNGSKVSQTLLDLPNGYYTVTALVASDAGNTIGIFAGATTKEVASDGTDGKTKFVEGTTGKALVSDGSLDIGANSSKWYKADNFRLTYYTEKAGAAEAWTVAKTAAESALDDMDYSNVTGVEKAALLAEIEKTEPTTAEDYYTATAALQNATSAFTDAKAAYDEIKAEYDHYSSLSGNNAYSTYVTSTTTAADWEKITNAIKTDEYTAVTTKYDTDGSALFIPSWDNSGFGSLTEQHWSGEEREYFDKWSGSPSSGSISKTVTLPQGHYVFYAAGRGQANSESAVTLKVVYGETTLTQDYTMKGDTGKGIDTSGAANFGEGTFAYNGAGRGWEWRYIAFELDSDTEVTLLIEGSVNNSWIGACDTKLLTYDNIAVNRQQYEAALVAAKEYLDDDMFEEDKASLNTVITDNTLTVNSATQAELTAATEALNAAAEEAAVDVARYTTYTNAATAIGENTNVDLTDLLKNPSFESSSANVLVAHGWTNEGVGIQGQTNNGFDGYREGNVFAERWANNVAIGAFKTYQTIDALPAGLYEVSVVATFNGSGASFFVDDATVAITDAGTYKLMAQVADKGNLTIGVQTINPTGSWFKCDNFQLKYVGTEFPEYELATGKMGTDKSAAQTAAETAFLSDKTAESYNALLAAIGEAETSVANYAALKTAIENAEAIKAANNFVTADAITTFEGVIASAQAAWDNVTYTDQQAKDEVGALGWHSCNYMGSAWVTPNPKPEVWWYFNTWSTEGNNDGTNFLTPFFENFKGSTDNLPDNTFTASLGGLENGTYEVEVWARVQRRTDANFNSNNSMITMSVNGGEAVSLMNGSTKVNQGANNEMRLDRFKAVGVVTDGTLTLAINVKLGSNVHWLSWRDVKYKKLDIDVPMFVSSVAEWGTFVAPFDVEIPEGVTAYTVDGVNENKELQMSKVEDNIIPAHTPVLLNSKDKVEETVSGVPQDLEGELKVGWLVGTYDKILAQDGWYILQKHDGKDEAAFYRVDTKTAQPEVPAYRAYLSVPSSEARVFYLNGEATAIRAIEALTVGEAEIYDVNGRRQVKLQKGVNIIRTKDGRTNKVMVK